MRRLGAILQAQVLVMLILQKEPHDGRPPWSGYLLASLRLDDVQLMLPVCGLVLLGIIVRLPNANLAPHALSQGLHYGAISFHPYR